MSFLGMTRIVREGSFSSPDRFPRHIRRFQTTLTLPLYEVYPYNLTLGYCHMLQDAATIRHYQKLTDAMGTLWERGYRFDDLRLYLDGYLAALRTTNHIEAYQVHRLEEESVRYLYDPSNFELVPPQTEPDYY
mgnify:CR=1 FL=1